MRILITGGCGFVGSNLALQLSLFHEVICFDNLRRFGSEDNVKVLLDYNIKFFHGDVRCKEDFEQLPEIDILIDAAAEPSVLSGINSKPDSVININLNGTLNCIKFALKHKAKFIFLSTSRVYSIDALCKLKHTNNTTRFGFLNDSYSIDEDFSTNGYKSFYGASKLASEMFIEEYCQFYNLDYIINRCGVIAGPGQFGKIDQGFVSSWIINHYFKKELSFIGFNGSGKQTRDILHIDDLIEAIFIEINNFIFIKNNTYNIGGGKFSSTSLLELTTLCEEITGNKIVINKILENRKADIPIYITNFSKFKNKQMITPWFPKKKMVDIVTDIFEWVKQNENKIKYLLDI